MGEEKSDFKRIICQWEDVDAIFFQYPRGRESFLWKKKKNVLKSPDEFIVNRREDENQGQTRKIRWSDFLINPKEHWSFRRRWHFYWYLSKHLCPDSAWTRWTLVTGGELLKGITYVHSPSEEVWQSESLHENGFEYYGASLNVRIINRNPIVKVFLHTGKYDSIEFYRLFGEKYCFGLLRMKRVGMRSWFSLCFGEWGI